MAVNRFNIRLLGDFNLSSEEGPVTAFHSARMQSLIAYLLLHRGVSQPRYHVAFLLWPDSEESQARSNLRNLIHRIRHTYPEIDSYLKEDNREICWRDDVPFQFDVMDFEATVARVKQDEETGNRNALLADLERAVELYTGDLLPSCYDEWILLYREQLRQSFLEALEKLSILQEELKQYRQAINSTQRLLRFDPLHETIYQRLMRLYALSGDRTGALRVYQTCVTVLKRELNVEPDAATRAAYTALMNYQPQPAQAQPEGQPPTQPLGRLPSRLSSFIGREREIAAVRQALSMTRLLTLTGPFGSGKTRLALEVSDRLQAEMQFPDGIYWVELAPVTDPGLVPQAVASVLDIREKTGESILRSLIDALRQRSLLLLFDNCEHLVAACSSLAADLLRACPSLKILTTSREALAVAGEMAWPVPPLSFPESVPASSLAHQAAEAGPTEEPGYLLRYESVRLFVERAALVLPTFQITSVNAPAVAQVCRRLEGLPFAVELAAARIKMMSVEQIASRLDDALPLLKTNRGSELAHHQTLQAAIDWSYNLLSAKDQALLRRLSVFRDGFTLEAAEQVTPLHNVPGESEASIFSSGDVLDLLSSLIDKSLVSVVERERSGEVRYRLLEMVRQYACKQLALAGENEQALRAHVYFFLDLTERAAPNLRSADQQFWINRLNEDHGNLRAALSWAQHLSGPGEDEIGLRLAAGLWQFWDVRGAFIEGRHWLQNALAKAPGQTLLRARMIKAAGALAWGQGDLPTANALLSESLKIFEALGEKRDIAAGMLNLSIVNVSQGNYASAHPYLLQSLQIFRETSHRQGISNVLNSLGIWASDQGKYCDARAYFEESMAIKRAMEDKRGIANLLGNLGVLALRQGDCQGARSLLLDCLDHYREIGDKRGEGETLIELAQAALCLGEPDTARQRLFESLVIWQELGHKKGIAAFLEGCAHLACIWSQYEASTWLLGCADVTRVSEGGQLAPVDQLARNEMISAIKQQLGEERFAACWAQGRTASPADAVQRAISLQPTPR